MSSYWGWYDDDRKKDSAIKIAEAVEAYHDKFGTAPNVVLVHEADLATHPGVKVRAASFLRRFTYWIGWEAEAPLEADPLVA